MDKKTQSIIQHKNEEVQSLLGKTDYLQKYIYDTLKSFAYRYFDEPLDPEFLTTQSIRVLDVEKGIKKAILIKNDQLRAGIGELVKRVSKAEGPTIAREIRVTLLSDLHAKKGEAKISARISFGHPAHDFSPGTFVEKVSHLHFEDELHFRNTLARHLEDVCELF